MRSQRVYLLRALALAATGLVGRPLCAQNPPVSTPPPAATGRVVKSPGNATWAADASEARERAEREKQLVFYEFVSPGCGSCRRMEALLFPAFDFEALLIGMVPVQVDIESSDGKALAARYGFKQAPAVLITNAQGRLVFLMEGFKDAGDFYAHAHADLDAYRKFARTVDSQDVAKLSADEAYSTGRELYERFDFEGAAARLRRAATAPGATPELRASALEGLAAAQLELGETTASRASIDEVIAMSKDPAQKERAQLFRAQIWLAENKPSEALKAYKKFAKDYPGSAYVEDVRGFIAKLEAQAPKP